VNEDDPNDPGHSPENAVVDPVFGLTEEGTTWIATATRDGVVLLLDAERPRHLRELNGHVGGITGARFSGDSRRLISCGMDRTIRIWHPESGTALRRAFKPRMRASTQQNAASGRHSRSQGAL